MGNDNLLLCYNRGCGEKYDPANNTEGSCRHHSGYPVFHDAYKGWSCCKKKCTDFTEFLNIPGCTYSFHSNVKPPEPEKPVVDKASAHEVIEVKPRKPPVIERPPFDTPLVRLQPTISASLRELIANIKTTKIVEERLTGKDNIPIGTACKNNACKVSYSGPDSLRSICTYHPGCPIFHEGLKYWSCCTKRTTEFESFLAQVGCTSGEHVWFKTQLAEGGVKCRLDWYQTGTHVYVSVFGKKCDPDSSIIELSPIRLRFTLSFPEQNGIFYRDMELAGVVDAKQSSVSMDPSKMEIKLKKVGGGSWSRLDVPRPESNMEENDAEEESRSSDSHVETVDLSGIY